MLDKFVETVLFEIVKYLSPTDFTKLTLLNKSLNKTLKGDLFWALRFKSKYGKLPKLKAKEEYKQKYIKKKQKVFTKELGGYHVSGANQSKEINISCLFEQVELHDNPKIRKQQAKPKKQVKKKNEYTVFNMYGIPDF